MDKNEENEKKLLGAFTNEDFVIEFREYCKTHDFKHRRLIPNLVRWWLSQDSIIQEHIYRGRFEEAHKQIAENLSDVSSARDVVARTKARTSKLKQKKEKKPSKSA